MTKKTRILLLNPPFFRFWGSSSGVFPIGLGYLKAVVKDISGVVVDIYDADFSKKSTEHSPKSLSSISVDSLSDKILDPNFYIYNETIKNISSFKPDIIGISVWSAAHEIVEILINRIKKEISKDIFIIAGGPHASAAPEELGKIKGIDIIVRGEGEKIFREIIKSYMNDSNIKKIKGISYYDKRLKKLINNPDMPIIKNINSLPYPDRTSSFVKDASPNYYSRIFSSRGCPFNCIFCDSHRVWGRNVRFRSPENIVKEIKELIGKYNVKNFTFSDDTFTLNKERTKEICKLIKNKTPDIGWTAGTRVNLVDKDLLKEMKDAGCTHIKFGVEAGNQKIMDKIKKGIRIDEVKKAVKLTKKIGLKQTTFFMVGHPEESREDINDTIKLAKELDAYKIWFNIVSPYPGTELSEIAKKRNLLDYNNWFELQHEGSATMKTDNLTKEEITVMFRDIVNEFEKINLGKQRKYLFKRLFNNQVQINNLQDLKRKISQSFDIFIRSYIK